MTDPDDIEEQRLLAAYRALPRPGPSAALDAAVLAHARAALPAARPARPRWVTGLATAAVLTLAVGTGWQLREAPLGDGPLSPAPSESDQTAIGSDAAVAEAFATDDDVANKAEAKLGAVDAEAQPAERMRDSASAPPQGREERQAATPDSAAARAQAARPPGVAEPPAAAAVPAPPSAPPPAAPPPAPPAPTVMQQAPAAPAASTLGKATGRELEGGARDKRGRIDTPMEDPAPRADRPSRAPAADAMASHEAQAATGSAPRTLSPLEWLDAIRRMRDQGDARRAADALAEFRAVYPDEPVPDDLKSLLR